MRRSLFLLAVLLVTQNTALAATCPVPVDSSPVVLEQSVEARSAYLVEQLPHARQNARRWFFWWTGGFLATTAGQVAIIPFWQDEEQQRTLWINAGSTLGGALFLAVAPPRMMRLETRLAQQFPEQDQSSCERLVFLQAQLEKASREERFNTSWLMHGGNLIFNVAAGLILGLAWDYWQSAWLTTAVGTLVGEIMIWTQPMDATKILTNYRTGAWTNANRRVSWGAQVHPIFLSEGAGLGATLHF